MPHADPGAAALRAAQVYLEQGRADRALVAIGRVEPNTRAYWMVRARALHDLGRYSEARSAAQRAMHDGEDWLVLYIMASSLTELGDLAEAEHTVLRALALEPTNAALLSLYARTLATGGQLEKALRVVAEARRHEPQQTHAMGTEACILWALGDDRQARVLVHEMLALNPEDNVALGLLSMLDADSGNMQESFARVRRMLANNPALISKLGPDLATHRAAGHTFMKPVSGTMTPHGPAVLWLTAIAGLLLGIAFQNLWLVGVAVIGYLIYIVYGHVVFWTLRWYYKRRMG
jgi:tetratricopeptide (TPR) repeat protein